MSVTDIASRQRPDLASMARRSLGERRRASGGRVSRHSAVVVLLLVASAAWGRGPFKLTTDPSAPTVRLESVGTSTKGGTVAVTAHVWNTRSSVATGQVSWVLVTPGKGSPWDRRVYRSGAQVVHLRPGSRATLNWDEQVLIPPGKYDVVAFTSVDGGRRWMPSDSSADYSAVVAVPADAPGLLRHGPPTNGVAIASAQVTPFGPGVDAVTATLGNVTSMPHSVALRWSLVPLRGAPSATWWRASLGGIGEVRQVSLPAGGQVPVSWDQAIPDIPGHFGLRLSIDPAPGTSELEDDVLVASTVLTAAVPPVGEVRLGRPTGPVLLTGLRVPAAWTRGGTATVRLTLQNISGAPQQVQLWWDLSPLGSQPAWAHAVGGVDPQTLTIPAGQTTTTVQPETVVEPPGDYELTAWVHVASGEAWVHSDGVMSLSRVRIPAYDASVVHPFPPTRLASIEEIWAEPTMAHGAPTSVRVLLVNAWARPAVLSLWWSLAAPGASGARTYPSAPVSVRLQPGESKQVTVDGVVAAPAGSYALQVWAHVQTPDGNFVHADGAAFSRVVTVR